MSLDQYVRIGPRRDLRDQVVQELTTTLVELDKLKRRRRDQQALVHEVDRVQRSLRWALLKLGPPVSIGLAP
jgi:signal transduction histidine kinase